MVSQVPLFLVIAESLLAFQASSYPELAGPDDADTEISAGDVDKIGSSASLAFFDDLLSYERAVEDDLAYRRQTVGVPFGYDLILESDEYMNVVCREAALIADRKSGHVGIVLGRPFVDSLVAAGTQRSLADQVRVFTYLVRISCKLVGSRGGVTGFGGDAVCFFRMIVGILRRLVRFDRAWGRAAGRPRGVPAPDEEQREMVLWPGALLHGRQGRAGHRAYHRLDTRVRGL